MTPKLRRYCWRIGTPIETESGEPCPECGSPHHKPLPDQNQCGKFTNRQMCILDRDHEGPCQGEP